MKKHKKNKKIFPAILCVMAGLIIFWLAVGLFLFFHKEAPAPEKLQLSQELQTPADFYVSSENVKQGDTVFIRLNSQADNVTGNFGNEKLVFYRKANSPEWISFLGIDADQNPGEYQIFVNTSSGEKLTKEIKVASADFSCSPVVASPNITKNGCTASTAFNNIIKDDNPAIKKFLSNLTSQPYFTTPFSFPLSTMAINGFSFGQFIGFGEYKLQHLGVDLKAPEKTEVYAVNDGKVVATLNLPNYGKTIIIDHGLDIFSMYLHLDKFEVSASQMVKKGQTIGLSGNTGYVTGAHLHFSMRVDGTRVDPIAFIETTKNIDNPFTADVDNSVLNIFK